MWFALSLAVADAFAPAERRLLVLTVVGTALLLVALWFGVSLLLVGSHVTGMHWLDLSIDLLGSVAALFVAWLIFPTMALLILGLFLDRIIASVERRHYPELPAPRGVGAGQALWSAIRLAALGLILNLFALPLYLLFPLVNLALFFALNGYLVGRGYYEAVAFRRLDAVSARAMWRRDRMRLVIAGTVIAALLAIPVVNLAAPLIGAAFMLHLFERLRRARQ